MTSPSLAYQDAMNGIAILYDALSNAENELEKFKNPWIKCSERMPELDDDGHSEMVLVAGRNGSIHLNFLIDDEWSLAMEATHWMPLPELPKEQV